MRCPWCDSEIPDSTKFCPNCGAEQPQKTEQSQQQPLYGQSQQQPLYGQSQQPTYTQQTAYSQSAAQPKKKSSLLRNILIAVVVYMLARGAGSFLGKSMAKDTSSDASGTIPIPSLAPLPTLAPVTLTDVTAKPDLLTLQKVFWESSEDGFSAFEAVRYGSDTNVVKELVYIYKFAKSDYLQEALESAEFKENFPAFATLETFDDGDDWTVVVRLEDIDTTIKLTMMIDKGLITKADESPSLTGIRADYYIDSILSQGGREATPAEVATLHLPE